MTRPPVSVVMPFAGTEADGRRALDTLLSLERRDGDELILADNAGVVPEVAGVSVVHAAAERSPAHARNAGADPAQGEWILFLDADVRPAPGLLDAYFAAPVEPEVGALAGAVAAAPDAPTLAARYAAARNFLSQEAHLAHPYRPRAVAANLLVRRAAFEQLGGFFEGLRAAEDTDFCWRLQEAGWRLELRSHAAVEHEYRATVAELRRQWRGYAAGRAWLARRYPGFTPEPGVVRAARRAAARWDGQAAEASLAEGQTRDGRRPLADAHYLALDALLALEELAGFVLSNRPAGEGWRISAAICHANASPPLVLVADRFPARGEPPTPGAARVEAAGRPDVVDRAAAAALPVAYREDDGIAARAAALAELALRHPLRCARDALARRSKEEPKLSALSPAALRIGHPARIQALGGSTIAQRLATLAGARLTTTSDS